MSNSGQPDSKNQGNSQGDAAGSAKKRSSKPKQAVVIIHGIGEQVPMSTLRGFVDAVWVTDPDLIKETRPDGDTGEAPRRRNPVWTKPDRRNRSFELRRITTEEDRNGVRTDFYEFYWAHLMHGNTFSQVWSWIVGLSRRPIAKVPGNVRSYYWFARYAVVISVLALITLPSFLWQMFGFWDMIATMAFLLAVPVVFFFTVVRGVLINVAGDVSRYVEPQTINVARRQEIREAGVQLFETLMGVTPEAIAANKEREKRNLPAQWDTSYGRIVVVGHSLGSIVGYDILKHAFARLNRMGLDRRATYPKRAALEQYCDNALNNRTDGAPGFCTGDYRRMQREAFLEMRENGSPWIVSDFVTVGAALTHAEFLMAEDDDDLHRQQAERIMPTCPPQLEWDRHTGKEYFSYRTVNVRALETDTHVRQLKEKWPDHFRVPQHAAHFAFTRWTNLYSPDYGLLKGDLVSGPVAEHFGMRKRATMAAKAAVFSGIRDIKVLDHKDTAEVPANRFTHLDYWELDGAKIKLSMTAKMTAPARWVTSQVKRRVQNDPEDKQRIPVEETPHHIIELRKAIDLLFDDELSEEEQKANRASDIGGGESG